MDGMGDMGGMTGGASPAPAHDHSAHDKYHSSVERLPDGSYRYTHGAWLGHMVPGAFFLAWGAWWALMLYARYVRCLAAKRPFRTQAWSRLPVGPPRLRAAPLEPLVKVVLPLLGVLGELWLGHESYRTLYQPNGQFVTDNLNDWQHSAMYTCFIASGVVDLLAHFCGAPAGTELGFLSLAFLGEGLLLVFHLKGPPVEILVHLILGLQVFATVLAILAELARPTSILAASLRPWLTMLQGAWWMQTAYIMYTGAPQWDPDLMASSMFVPVPFVLLTVGIAFAMLCTLLVFKAIAEWRLGRRLSFDPSGEAAAHTHMRLPSDDSAAEGYMGAAYGSNGAGGDLEMSGLVLKTYAADGDRHA
ncbi:Transmembrane 45B [Chlorella sorokiniana]|uniref:Transmembrane 45B n=1 Tax=Chlorella sorokiniana TaxID=3076 RepID=A0A2P6TK19_CHLSO|nr:Transmembrane 45B [Chlorella sorokiniana]|eukprot:PRW44434.1 Transmembrane 45B [Chlorella sorokiniana]